MISVIDLFCGTGGLSFGLQMEDDEFVTVGAIDIDAVACETARANHPEATVVNQGIGDLAPLDFLSMTGASSVDVIVGGPPCQGFTSLRPSRAEGVDDPRNSLYRDFIRYVAELRPSAFLMENVVGLVGANEGRLLHDLLGGFRNAGYATDWRILNAAGYGIPQKRERFFLLGVRSDLSSPSSLRFPQPTRSFDGRTIGIKNRNRMLDSNSDMPDVITTWQAISDLSSIGPGEASSLYASEPRNSYQALMRGTSDSVKLHQAANHNAKMRAVMAIAGSSKQALPEGMVSSGYSSCYSRMSPDEPAPTITVKFTSPASSKCIHPFDNRAITPREAARLQGFPDDFEFRGTKTQIASQIGNAVPPLLATCFAPILKELVTA